MAKKFGFTSFTISQFENWIANISVARTVSRVQEHHTWRPNYSSFNGSNHFELQRNMKHHHVSNNGWNDIGQHFSIFPDGRILTGRPLNKSPACIYGANSRSICIESIGDFDLGKDSMNSEQSQAIIRTTAALVKRFSSINADDKGIVYHHWFDLSTGKRTNGSGSTKSCPGTNFFGGNSVADFNVNFLPKVEAAISGAVPTQMPSVDKYVVVTADFLNIRTGPNSSFSLVQEQGPAEMGAILRVFVIESNWFKVSNSKENWVYGRYTYEVTQGTVNTDETNCRNGPGLEFDVMSIYDSGDAVFIQDRNAGWLKIDADAWVHESLVT